MSSTPRRIEKCRRALGFSSPGRSTAGCEDFAASAGDPGLQRHEVGMQRPQCSEIDGIAGRIEIFDGAGNLCVLLCLLFDGDRCVADGASGDLTDRRGWALNWEGHLGSRVRLEWRSPEDAP